MRPIQRAGLERLKAVHGAPRPIRTVAAVLLVISVALFLTAR